MSLFSFSPSLATFAIRPIRLDTHIFIPSIYSVSLVPNLVKPSVCVCEIVALCGWLLWCDFCDKIQATSVRTSPRPQLIFCCRGKYIYICICAHHSSVFNFTQISNHFEISNRQRVKRCFARLTLIFPLFKFVFSFYPSLHSFLPFFSSSSSSHPIPSDNSWIMLYLNSCNAQQKSITRFI